MTAASKNITQQYEKHSESAVRLKDDLLRELRRKLSDQGAVLGVPLEGRLKSLASIEEKISRKGIKLENLFDLDDLIGIRIILLFHRHISLVDSVIADMFDVISVEDTALRLSDAQFGYQSRHYLIRVKTAWMELPSFADSKHYKIEIQVRTLAQHIWASVSHELQYKREESVPPKVRRAIHRASALLETVDLEFERVLGERDLYLLQQKDHPVNSEHLNVDILRAVLDDILPDENRSTNEAYADLLADLTHFGVHTRADLISLVKQHWDSVAKEEARLVETSSHHRDELDHNVDSRPSSVYFVHTGLVREALRVEFGDDEVSNWLAERPRNE